MYKKFTLLMTATAIVFMGAFSVFANSENNSTPAENNNQIQIQSGVPSRNLGNLQSNTAFQDQLEQMKEMQNKMRESMNNTFKDPLFKHASVNPNTALPQADHSTYPQIKFFEKNNAYVAQFIVPGMEKKDIEIEVKQNILKVSGNTEQASKTTDKNNTSSYSFTNEFSQSIKIPDNAATSKITSDYKNGILTIIIPKSETKDIKPQIIPIN